VRGDLRIEDARLRDRLRLRLPLASGVPRTAWSERIKRRDFNQFRITLCRARRCRRSVAQACLIDCEINGIRAIAVRPPCRACGLPSRRIARRRLGVVRGGREPAKARQYCRRLQYAGWREQDWARVCGVRTASKGAWDMISTSATPESSTTRHIADVCKLTRVPSAHFTLVSSSSWNGRGGPVLLGFPQRKVASVAFREGGRREQVHCPSRPSPLTGCMGGSTVSDDGNCRRLQNDPPPMRSFRPLHAGLRATRILARKLAGRSNIHLIFGRGEASETRPAGNEWPAGPALSWGPSPCGEGPAFPGETRPMKNRLEVVLPERQAELDRRGLLLAGEFPSTL